jgi:hypothetical protein
MKVVTVTANIFSDTAFSRFRFDDPPDLRNEAHHRTKACADADNVDDELLIQVGYWAVSSAGWPTSSWTPREECVRGVGMPEALNCLVGSALRAAGRSPSSSMSTPALFASAKMPSRCSSSLTWRLIAIVEQAKVRPCRVGGARG